MRRTNFCHRDTGRWQTLPGELLLRDFECYKALCDRCDREVIRNPYFIKAVRKRSRHFIISRKFVNSAGKGCMYSIFSTFSVRETQFLGMQEKPSQLLGCPAYLDIRHRFIAARVIFSSPTIDILYARWTDLVLRPVLISTSSRVNFPNLCRTVRAREP